MSVKWATDVRAMLVGGESGSSPGGRIIKLVAYWLNQWIFYIGFVQIESIKIISNAYDDQYGMVRGGEKGEQIVD